MTRAVVSEGSGTADAAQSALFLCVLSGLCGFRSLVNKKPPVIKRGMTRADVPEGSGTADADQAALFLCVLDGLCGFRSLVGAIGSNGYC